MLRLKAATPLRRAELASGLDDLWKIRMASGASKEALRIRSIPLRAKMFCWQLNAPGLQGAAGFHNDHFREDSPSIKPGKMVSLS